MASASPDLTALIYVVNEALRTLQPPGDDTGRGLPTVEEAERLVEALRDLDALVATVHPTTKDEAA